jgi:hypothetical protein
MIKKVVSHARMRVYSESTCTGFGWSWILTTVQQGPSVVETKQIPCYGLIGFRFLLDGLVDVKRRAYMKHGLCEGSRSSLVTYHLSKWKARKWPLDHLKLMLLFMVKSGARSLLRFSSLFRLNPFPCSQRPSSSV